MDSTLIITAIMPYSLSITYFFSLQKEDRMEYKFHI